MTYHVDMFFIRVFKIIVKVLYVLGRRSKSFVHSGTIRTFYDPWTNVRYPWIERDPKGQTFEGAENH
jgi:hypothetical protein